jgi:hypothetical protein
MFMPDDGKQSADTQKLSQQPAPLAQKTQKNVQNSESKQSKSQQLLIKTVQKHARHKIKHQDWLNTHRTG